MRWTVLLFLLAGLLLRAESLTGRAIWYDEAYSLWRVSQEPASILEESAHNDPHPPGYYLLLWGWSRLFGAGLQQARALSTVAWAAAVALTYRLASEWFGRGAGLGAVALLSLNAFQVVGSTEARMYMVLQSLAVAATWLLWRAAGTGRPWPWVAYGLAAAAMAYTSYYSVFLLVAHAAWVGLSLRRVGLRGPGAALATAVGAYLPWLPFLPGSVTANPVPWRPPPDLRWGAEIVMSQVYGGHFLGAAGYYGGGPVGAVHLTLGLLPALLVAAGAVRASRVSREAARLCLMSWGLPLLVVAVLSWALGKVAAYTYHVLYLQPFVAMLLAAAVEDVWSGGRGARWLAQGLAFSVVLGYAAVGSDAAWRDVRYNPFRYDLAAAHLGRLVEPGDAVVYAPQGMRRLVHHYYVPPARELQLYVDFRDEVRSVEAAVVAIRDLLGERPRRVWLVVSPPVPAVLPEEVARALEQAGYVRGPASRFGAVTVAVAKRM